MCDHDQHKVGVMQLLQSPSLPTQTVGTIYFTPALRNVERMCENVNVWKSQNSYTHV